MNDFGTFFLPGPTEVRQTILQAMTQPMIGHRSEAFAAMHRRIVYGLQQIAQTTRPVYTVSGSATAVMEMAVRGAPEGPILSLVNGGFGERFARVAQGCARPTHIVHVPWGESHPLDLVEAHLVRARYSAMTVVHSETSTGVLADLHALTQLAHRHGVMILADSVTGLGALPVHTDAWGVDFIFTGSQKALAMPPGLGFAVASEAYIRQASAGRDRGRYLDPIAYEEAALADGTPTTPAIPLFYAADAQLADILREGVQIRWARHRAMLAQMEQWVESQHAAGVQIGFLARAGARSPSISCLTVPPHVTARAIVAAMHDRGFTIGRGYGQMQDSTIRIGHMGDHTVAGLTRCLDALAAVLAARH